MADKFESYRDGVSSPAREMFVITPNDTSEVSTIPKAIRANTDGTVVLRAMDSTTDVTIAMVAGEVLAVRAKFVRAAGTTASLHGLV